MVKASALPPAVLADAEGEIVGDADVEGARAAGEDVDEVEMLARHGGRVVGDEGGSKGIFAGTAMAATASATATATAKTTAAADPPLREG